MKYLILDHSGYWNAPGRGTTPDRGLAYRYSLEKAVRTLAKRRYWVDVELVPDVDDVGRGAIDRVAADFHRVAADLHRVSADFQAYVINRRCGCSHPGSFPDIDEIENEIEQMFLEGRF